MLLDCKRKLEYLQETHVIMRKTYRGRIHTLGLEVTRLLFYTYIIKYMPEYEHIPEFLFIPFITLDFITINRELLQRGYCFIFY